MEYVLVIDVGTSSVRGSILSREGEVIFCHQAKYTVQSDERGWVQQDMNEFIDVLGTLISQTGEACRSLNVVLSAVSVTSQRSSVIPSDQDGRPLYPAIMWLDRRTEKICREINRKFDIYQICAMKAGPIFSAPKIMWIRENMPELYKITYKMLGFHELVLHYLTGEFVTDTSVASRSALLDIRTLKWSEQLLDIFGVDESKLCRLLPPGSVAGRLKKEIQCLLSCGPIPVITAGGDQQCASLGMGMVESGIVSVNLGTGAFVTTLSKNAVFFPDRQVICNGAAVPEKWILETSSMASGMVYDWVKRLFFVDYRLEEMEKSAAFAGMGAHSLLMLPYMLGTGTDNREEGSRGAFFNIGIYTEKGDFARAALEALAGEIFECLQKQRLDAANFHKVVCSGGLSRSRLYTQILADTCNLPIEIQKRNEATTMGAYISAAVALGWWKSVQDAWKKVRGKADCCFPDKEKHEVYMEIHRKRQRLSQAIAKP